MAMTKLNQAAFKTALDALVATAPSSATISSVVDARGLCLTILVDDEPWGAPFLFESAEQLEEAAAAAASARQRAPMVGETTLTHIEAALTAVVETLCERDKAERCGLPTGFEVIDRRILGMQAGDLIVVGGRPGMGRTSFALNVAEHCAIEIGEPVAFLSTESTSQQLALKLLASVGRLDSHRMGLGKFTEDEWSRLSFAIGKAHEAPLYFDKRACRSVHSVIDNARALADERGEVGLVVVDRLQGLAHAGDPGVRALELSNIAASLKALGMELQCPVVVTSSLNRNLELRPDKHPLLCDLRDSGAIEDEADVVLMLYRDQLYNQDSLDRGVADVEVAKLRRGPLGRERLYFLEEYGRFEALPLPY